MKFDRAISYFALILLGMTLFLRPGNVYGGWTPYVQFGGGLARATNTSPYFSTQGNSLSTAYSGNFAIGTNLQSRMSGLLFQLGIQDRYFSATAPDVKGAQKSFTFMPLYPEFRVEFWRLVFGVGYTPYVFNGIGLTQMRNTTALLGEVNFLFPITPEIDFGLGLAEQRLTQTGITAPTTIEYGVFFRLNFGMSEGQSNERRKYKGWRYPFGIWTH